MKKVIFPLIIALLTSCQSLNSSLESDKEDFKNQSDFSSDISLYFSVDVNSIYVEDTYRIEYTIYQPKDEFNNSHVIISPDKETFFIFGYDNDYVLSSASDKNNKVKGISIYFSSSIKIDTLYSYFKSDEVELYYIVKF